MTVTTGAGRLAIDGGTPVRSAPMPPRRLIDTEERDAVMALFEREISGEGNGFDRYGGVEVDAYEKEFAAYFGARFATAVSAGTAAIHTALGALRLDAGREVVCAPITDPGAVMPIVWLNLIPVFADADPETFNMDPRSVAERITERTGAIIATHITGQPCDLDPILAAARARDIPVIEDCAQAHDARYKGRRVGGIGTIGAFSLMGGKHSTAGGQGGMVVTDDEEIYWNAKRFADRGKPFNSTETKNLFLGLNYRMTEIEAAIGRVQLQKLAGIVERRRAFVAELRARMAGLRAVRLGHEIPEVESAYWFLMLRVEEDRLRVSKDQFAAAVKAEGLPVHERYDFLIYESPWVRARQTFGQSGWPWTTTENGRAIRYEDSCPNARRAIDTHFTLSIHEGYSPREAEDIAAALRKVESAYLA